MQIRLIALGVLKVNLYVDTILVASFGERILDAFGAGVKSGMFDQLNNAYRHEFSLGRLLVATPRKRKRGNNGKRNGAAARNIGNLHGITPL